MRSLVSLRAALTGLLLVMIAGCGTLVLNQPPPDVTPHYAYVTDFNGGGAGRVLGFTVDSNTGVLTPLGSASAGAGPTSIGSDATGAIVYVANSDGSISGFIVNATSGALQSIPGSFTAGIQPVSIAVDPTDRFVYVANAGSSSVSAFHETAATGVLTPLTSSFPTAGTPRQIIIDPSGRFVYVTEGTAGTAVFIINADASLTLQQMVQPANTAATAIALEPRDRFAYIADNQSGVTAYQVDSTSGRLTAIAGATFTAGNAPVAVVADPSGSFLFVANGGSSDIAAFTINGNGFLTPAGARQKVTSPPLQIVADPSGKFVYAVSSQGVSGFIIGSNGILSPTGTTTAGTNPSAVTVLP